MNFRIAALAIPLCYFIILVCIILFAGAENDITEIKNLIQNETFIVVFRKDKEQSKINKILKDAKYQKSLKSIFNENTSATVENVYDMPEFKAITLQVPLTQPPLKRGYNLKVSTALNSEGKEILLTEFPEQLKFFQSIGLMVDYIEKSGFYHLQDLRFTGTPNENISNFVDDEGTFLFRSGPSLTNEETSRSRPCKKKANLDPLYPPNKEDQMLKRSPISEKGGNLTLSSTLATDSSSSFDAEHLQRGKCRRCRDRKDASVDENSKSVQFDNLNNNDVSSRSGRCSRKSSPSSSSLKRQESEIMTSEQSAQGNGDLTPNSNSVRQDCDASHDSCQIKAFSLNIPEGQIAQTDAVWNLRRISYREISIHLPYLYYSRGQGENIDCYVIDSGILADHQEIRGRAFHKLDLTGEKNRDTIGHGTHIAATIGGHTYGVAKKSTLYSVKIFDKSGRCETSALMNALYWVYEQVKNSQRKSVINMSLAGTRSAAVRQMVESIYKLGNALVVAAAGNDGKDSCSHSPGDSPDVITVGAIDINDEFAPFSCHGKCVDVSAPGVSILSANSHSLNGIKRNSGTSMATPHVTGAIANVWSLHPSASAKDIMMMLKSFTTQGRIKRLPQETYDRILYSLFAAANP